MVVVVVGNSLSNFGIFFIFRRRHQCLLRGAPVPWHNGTMASPSLSLSNNYVTNMKVSYVDLMH